MERNNPKQLKLTDEVGKLAEKVHLQYQAVFGVNMTFREFGNMVMRYGLHDAAVRKPKGRRQRRKING